MIRIALLIFALAIPFHAQTLDVVTGVEPQPFKAQVRRVAEALQACGNPLTAAENQRLESIIAMPDGSGTKIRFGKTRVCEPIGFVAVRLTV